MTTDEMIQVLTSVSIGINHNHKDAAKANIQAIISRLKALEAVARVADKLVYRVIGQREIQDDELSALPISELKDTLDALGDDK